MRHQLTVDLKARLNKDGGDTVIAALEAINAIEAKLEALIAQLEADKADISSTDFAALSNDDSINID